MGIEARTALQMAKRQILPAVVRYSGQLAQSVVAIKAAEIAVVSQTDMLREVCDLTADLRAGVAALEARDFDEAEPLIGRARRDARSDDELRFQATYDLGWLAFQRPRVKSGITWGSQSWLTDSMLSGVIALQVAAS